MSDYLLGLDYGTGGAKACIIDTDGRVLGFAFEEYPIYHDFPGWSEHDAQNYWTVACRLIRICMNKAAVAAADIKGIAVSSALPSLVMVDRAGHPVHHAYNLMDKRAVDQVVWLKAHIGEDRLFTLSGYRLEDHPLLINVLWEKRHRPEAFASVHKVHTIDGFITLKLTGQSTCHYSAAAFYGVAYNMRQRQFDFGLLKELDIDPALLPDLCECDDIIGRVTPDAAAETGLLAGTPVAGGQVDCNASWIGAGAIEIGDFQSNLGTVGNFGIIHQNEDFNFSDIGRLMINFPYTVNSSQVYVTVPTTTTGGQCIRWIRDQLAQDEIDAEQHGGASAYDVLNQLAEQVPPGSDALIALPFFMGERTPIWDVNARAVLFGLTLKHGVGHIVRAMMEAVAFAMYDSFRLIKEAGLKINYPMVLNEGGAVSRLWRQIIADVFNVPIVLVKNRTGAPYGDAILAGVATGLFRDFTVAKKWVEYIEPMQPDPKNHQNYMHYFELYKSLYEHTKADFRQLAELRSGAY
ncbi:FGGY-family carbohydrate kinase [candidate division KSB1 bacterium]|nr:FGGY-family carbohydrate kinase [candidate division KSB1 bacterium]